MPEFACHSKPKIRHHIYEYVYLAVQRHELPLSLHTCVLARDRTHKALEPLFESRVCFGLVGARLFEDREQAMAYLLGKL